MSLCNSMTYIKGAYSHTKEDSKTSKYRTGIGLISTTSRVPTIFFSLPYFVVSFKLIYRWKYFGFECPYGVKPQADSLLLLKIKTYQPCKKNLTTGSCVKGFITIITESSLSSPLLATETTKQNMS